MEGCIVFIEGEQRSCKCGGFLEFTLRIRLAWLVYYIVEVAPIDAEAGTPLFEKKYIT
jgi:hypothetical protein